MAPIEHRTSIEQAIANLENAIRALRLAQRTDAASMCPHPLIVARAEVKNAVAYMEKAQ